MSSTTESDGVEGFPKFAQLTLYLRLMIWKMSFEADDRFLVEFVGPDSQCIVYKDLPRANRECWMAFLELKDMLYPHWMDTMCAEKCRQESRDEVFVPVNFKSQVFHLFLSPHTYNFDTWCDSFLKENPISFLKENPINRKTQLVDSSTKYIRPNPSLIRETKGSHPSCGACARRSSPRASGPSAQTNLFSSMTEG